MSQDTEIYGISGIEEIDAKHDRVRKTTPRTKEIDEGGQIRC